MIFPFIPPVIIEVFYINRRDRYSNHPQAQDVFTVLPFTIYR